MRKRTRPTWQVPAWTVDIENWTAAQIQQNMWRFDIVDEFDDLMQEARILFWVLGQKYPICSEPGHLFSIYKTSLKRRFIDKTRILARSPIDQTVEAEQAATALELEGNLPNTGHLNLLIEELPDELKIVLRHLTGGRVRRKLDRPTRHNYPRENHNMRLRRRFRLSSVDPVGDLRGYFAKS